MTATTLSHLPLAAGSAAAAALGRFIVWTFDRFMRAPLANSALVAMVTLSALAGSNALYFQVGRHPAPLFAPAMDVPVAINVGTKPPVSVPVIAPAVPPRPRSNPIAGVTPPSPAGPVGNPDVYEVQKRLSELQLFTGTVDGYYGPMTAKAIREFEVRNGLQPMGAMTPELVDAIRRVNSDASVPAQQQGDAEPQPLAQQAPEIVLAPAADRVVARLPSIEPQEQIGEALSAVAESAAETIDSIVAGIDGGQALPIAPAIVPTPSQLVPMVIVQAAPVQQAAIVAPPVVAGVEQTTQNLQITASADTGLTAKVQRGLSSLGFLHGPIDGHAGEATAKAIRNFEVYYNYSVTGQVSAQLVDLLVAAGASV